MLIADAQEWAGSNKVPMLHREVKPHAAVNTATLYKTEEEAAVAPTNILQVSMFACILQQHLLPCQSMLYSCGIKQPHQFFSIVLCASKECMSVLLLHHARMLWQLKASWQLTALTLLLLTCAYSANSFQLHCTASCATTVVKICCICSLLA